MCPNLPDPTVGVFPSFFFFPRCGSDPSKQLLSRLLGLSCPCLSSCQMLCNTRQQLAEPRSPSGDALRRDILAQEKHEDTITASSRSPSVSMCPSAARFTAASAAPRQQRAARLCFHHRQEGRRKLNEVSTEHYVNEREKKKSFYQRRRRDVETHREKEAESMLMSNFKTCIHSFQILNIPRLNKQLKRQLKKTPQDVNATSFSQSQQHTTKT